MPDRTISSGLYRLDRELAVRCLEFLQANDVRGLLLQPTKQDFEPPVHSIDIIGGDPHGYFL